MLKKITAVASLCLLFIINEGLEYRIKCRVIDENQKIACLFATRDNEECRKAFDAFQNAFNCINSFRDPCSNTLEACKTPVVEANFLKKCSELGGTLGDYTTGAKPMNGNCSSLDNENLYGLVFDEI